MGNTNKKVVGSYKVGTGGVAMGSKLSAMSQRAGEVTGYTAMGGDPLKVRDGEKIKAVVSKAVGG